VVGAVELFCAGGNGLCGYMADSVLDVSQEDIYQNLRQPALLFSYTKARKYSLQNLFIDVLL